MQKAPETLRYYDHAIDFKAMVIQQCTANPVKWLKREKQHLVDARLARTGSTLSLIKERRSIQSVEVLNNKMRRVRWKGTPLDLTNDPHRHLLHDEEVLLALTLRLNCATYLTTKRRIILARTEFFKKKMTFRKTHAQQACNIDVNKASQLWVAFDSVGWFNDRQ